MTDREKKPETGQNKSETGQNKSETGSPDFDVKPLDIDYVKKHSEVLNEKKGKLI